MKIGLDDYTIYSAGLKLNAIEILKKAKELGFEGVHFSTTASFKDLSKDYLSKFKGVANDLDLYVELGMGSCNPFSDCRTSRDLNRDPRKTLRELIQVAKFVDAPVIRTFFGFSKERLFKNPSLQEQIEATYNVLKDIKNIVEDYEIKIALENHLTLTSYELRDLIERLDSEYIGICFDTGNTLILLEDPVEATKVLLPYIFTTHIKDGVIFSCREGASWVATPIGAGMVDLTTIIKIISKFRPDVNFNLEDEANIFPVPIYNRDFIKSLDHLNVQQMVKVIKWLRFGDNLIKSGEIPCLDKPKEKDRHKVVRNRMAKNVENIKRYFL